MTVPEYEHDAHVYRTSSGWQRWHAYCACGWQWTGTGGRQDAERAARTHDGNVLEHSCYDPSTMEYDPGPCAACLAEAVDPPEQTAAQEIGEYLAGQPLTAEEIHERDRHDEYRRRRP